MLCVPRGQKSLCPDSSGSLPVSDLHPGRPFSPERCKAVPTPAGFPGSADSFPHLIPHSKTKEPSPRLCLCLTGVHSLLFCRNLPGSVFGVFAPSPAFPTASDSSTALPDGKRVLELRFASPNLPGLCAPALGGKDPATKNSIKINMNLSTELNGGAEGEKFPGEVSR